MTFHKTSFTFFKGPMGRGHLGKIAIVLALVVLGLWTLPLLLSLPSLGLDPSWVIGLNMAIMDNLQFGKDIVLTFGPLGFLYIPTYVDFGLWTISLSFTLLTHSFLLFSIAQLAVKSSVTWMQYLFMAATLLFSLPVIAVGYKLTIAVTIVIYLVLTDRINDKLIVYTLIILSFLLAVVSLVKFTAVLISMSIIFITAAVLFHKGRIKWSVIMLPAYIASLLSLWVLSGQEIANFPLYFQHSLEVSRGYSLAMAISGPSWHLIIGLFAIGAVVGLWIRAIRKKQFNLLLFIFLFSGIIFVSFKHGFVRHDGHVNIFFTNMLLFLCLLHVSNGKEFGKAFRYIIPFISLMFFVVVYVSIPWLSRFDVAEKVSVIKSPLPVLLDADNRKHLKEAAKENIRKGNPLSERSLAYLREGSVDIFPWEVSLAYAYDLDWHPRPVFQSYSAYTVSLDILNARHFQSSNAPEKVMYSYISIDGRYPAFDEPATFRELLCRYSARYIDGGFVLLEKKEENRCGAEEILSSSVSDIGEPIEIPKHDGGYVFARISLEYSWFGKLVTLFYKPSKAYVRINTNNFQSNIYRFIPDVARNGIFLSQYIEGNDDLYSIFSGNIDLDKGVEQISIEVDNKLHYKEKMSIEFYLVSAEVSLITSMPIWQDFERASGGLIVIDSVNNQLYASLKEKVMADFGKNKKMTIRGWAVDDQNKNSGGGVYLVLRRHAAEKKIISAIREHRPDVAKHFGEEGYKKSGWLSTFNTQSFSEGCYSLSVRILREDGKKYYELDSNKQICF